MSIAVYMPIGPSDDEVARAADVLDSVEAFSESLRWIVLVDDAREPRGLERRLACRAPCELVVLHNPRNGVGNGRTGGMCVSNLLAYGYIHRHTDAAWVLKLDTDSLVIGPFEERLRAAIAARPDAGLIGVIGDSIAPDRTYHFMDHNRRAFELALRVGDVFPELMPGHKDGLRRWGVTGEAQFEQFLRARHVLARAVDRGYRTAEYVQGGGYVLTRRLIEAMARAGRFDDPFVWCELEIPEDVMMGIHCASEGLAMHDLSGPNQPFTVEGPLPFTPVELAGMNTSVIHSIKGDTEAGFRRFFRARRPRRARRPGGDLPFVGARAAQAPRAVGA
jgi:hypothetical protein